MGYVRAEEVLPPEILLMVQQYVDGQMIYIPRKADCHRDWGTLTETKRDLGMRNQQIYAEYQSGDTIGELAERYHLTGKSVQRIIRSIRK